MPAGKRPSALRCLTDLVVCIVSLSIISQTSGSAANEPTKIESYSPVAPVQSLLYATRLNLKLVTDWLDEGDYESAADTIDRLSLLLDLCDAQSGEETWRHGIGQLRARLDQVKALASSKDTSAALAAARECFAALESLEANSIKGAKNGVADFTPHSSVRTFMKLLDCSYSDAKSAKSLDGVTAMSYTIAETIHAARFLRDDPQWRERAGEVREAALKVATLKTDTDLKVARQELKNVYERCMACHKLYRR